MAVTYSCQRILNLTDNPRFYLIVSLLCVAVSLLLCEHMSQVLLSLH